VIGAGVIGLAIGAAFARKGREAFVLEAGPRVGCGISSRNSEVIHSGIYYPTNSLKHRLCVEGRKMLYAYCDKRGIPYARCGKLVVATDEREAKKVAEIAARASDNGIEAITHLGAEAASRLEPSIKAIAALRVRETGVIDSQGLLNSLVGEIEEGGGAVMLHHRVVGGSQMASGGFELDVLAPPGSLAVTTRNLIIATGLRTHAVAAAIDRELLAGAPPLRLAKGSYFSYSGHSPFSHLIYPAPVDGGLGIHLTFDLGGRARFGPDVEWLESSDPDAVDYRVDAGRANRFYAAIRRYWPDLGEGTLTPEFAGARPKLSGPGAQAADFLLHGPQEHGVPGAIALYGIESPGLTSSLAIGARVERILQ
jgi:L-2-hydroxyglutarate oxidase LhgO